MMQCKPTLLLACLAAALLLASSSQAAAARPGRHLTQAIATASSVAGPGETVSSSSNAKSENGQLTVSNVQAQGAGPGTTVNCEQEARNGQVKSVQCGGTAATTATPASTTTTTTNSPSGSWESAPACKKAYKEYKVVFGSEKPTPRPWSFEDNRSCALRDAKGNPTGP